MLIDGDPFSESILVFSCIFTHFTLQALHIIALGLYEEKRRRINQCEQKDSFLDVVTRTLAIVDSKSWYLSFFDIVVRTCIVVPTCDRLLQSASSFSALLCFRLSLVAFCLAVQLSSELFDLFLVIILHNIWSYENCCLEFESLFSFFIALFILSVYLNFGRLTFLFPISGSSYTVNPRISPLGAYLFFMLFGWGLIRGGGL